MRIRYTRRAQADISAIHSYIDAQSPAAADNVIAALEDSISRLAQFPDLAPKTDEPGVRELTLVRYPYKVYYEAGVEELPILHVRDARRLPWPSEPDG